MFSDQFKTNPSLVEWGKFNVAINQYSLTQTKFNSGTTVIRICAHLPSKALLSIIHHGTTAYYF